VESLLIEGVFSFLTPLGFPVNFRRDSFDLLVPQIVDILPLGPGSFSSSPQVPGHKKISSDDLMVIVCPSDSEDALENDYSDEDPTVQYSSLVPDSSDSEEEGPLHSEQQFVPEKPAVFRRGPLHLIMTHSFSKEIIPCHKKF
jgi:hypothetical protein